MSVVSYSREGNVAVLTLDSPPVNALSHKVRKALLEGFERAAEDGSAEAIVLICAGQTFIAGADITEFQNGMFFAEPTLYDVQDAMEASAKPIVAAIHGTALGGGFEVALTCHWRVAVEDARFGFPEVNLGVLPGAGGTQRFTRLAGPKLALEYIISGRQFGAPKALEWGAVDAVVDDLEAGAIGFACKVVAEKRPLRLVRNMTEKVTGIDPKLFADAYATVATTRRGLDAPPKIVECIEAACTLPPDKGFAVETDRFNELRDGGQNRALVYQFFAEREARKIPQISKSVKPIPIASAAVIGAGTMGGGIAMCFANAGIPVALVDANADALARGRKIIEANYARSVQRGSRTQASVDKALGLIAPALDFEAVGDADIVVEAVFEDMGVKKDVFARLDAAAKPDAILATNTSTLDIDEIARATSRSEKVVGAHFFSPANVMRVLENVRGKETSDETIATVMALGRTLGKIAVLAGNCHGFIGNRMFEFCMDEANFLLEDGATPDQIDGAMEEFGMAMGPLATIDLAGVDVVQLINKARAPLLPKGERVSPIIERLHFHGRLGQKTAKGYYAYDGRKRSPDPEAMGIIEHVSKELHIKRRKISSGEIVARLLHPMINEGARILEEHIALRPGDIDVLFVHGYGFPAYRGGPMYWGQSTGLEHVIETARDCAKRHGPRWAPAPLLETLVAKGEPLIPSELK